MKKKFKLAIILIVIAIIAVVIMLCFMPNKTELKAVKSNKELLRIYEGDERIAESPLIQILTLPFSMEYHGKSSPITNGMLDMVESARE